MSQEIYEASGDSYLLEYYVGKLSRGLVLDLGTGSGIQAKASAVKNEVQKVFAVDINPKVIENCKKTIKINKIVFFESNLFSIFKNKKIKFDTIIFNSPYLPQEFKERHIATEGGIKGWETIERFLKDTGTYLAKKGIILLVFSSLTNKAKVDELIEQNFFDSIELDNKHTFFETIYVYLLTKKPVIDILTKKEIKELKYFSHGKRGIILTGEYKNKKIAVKIKKPDSEAIERIQNEAKILRIVNKKGIGAKLLLAGNDFVAYEFAQGKTIQEWIQEANKKEIIKVFNEVFAQCYEIDKLGITKEEMHHPWKHVIVGKKVTLIDFERAKHTKDPQNVAQFVQCIMNLQEPLKKKGIKLSRAKLIELARKYQYNRSEENFKRIIAEIK